MQREVVMAVTSGQGSRRCPAVGQQRLDEGEELLPALRRTGPQKLSIERSQESGQVHEVADGAHVVHWTEPERVNPLLLPFLTG